MKAFAIFGVLLCVLLIFPDLMTVAYASGINGGLTIGIVVFVIIIACWGDTTPNSDLR